MYNLLPIVTSFLITVTLLPIVIRVFKSINLLDTPDSRKLHTVSTPSLGGIAIFSGVLFSLIVSCSVAELAEHKFLVLAATFIFLLGIRDDLSSLMAKHKLVIQVFAAFLVVYFGGFEISGLHGLLGVTSFPYNLNKVFTIFFIVVMTNSFNLIDGIDGLAGSVALVVTLFFGWFFYVNGEHLYAITSVAIAGGTLGFLMYNWYPSKVFMGDTGSMTIGFMISALLVKFLSITPMSATSIDFSAPVAVCVALLILPVYDTSRVFTIRFYQGKSPLSPDRNHVHHIFLNLGLNHAQSTVLLVGYNVLVLSFVLFFQHWGEMILIPTIFGFSVLMGALLDFKVTKKEAARTARLVSAEMKLSKSA